MAVAVEKNKNQENGLAEARNPAAASGPSPQGGSPEASEKALNSSMVAGLGS